ncbi:hypothetical protein THRCLA_22777 [Thraustotheca clavata]|uniref:Uncharacterized protein n=1 Tax=Thraustotheca clavata TaxID=74557 RepID=A0A1V9YT87_9STRA|nr:hypothetical protein THRCLA_22777 [Thraustotheca clavata]
MASAVSASPFRTNRALMQMDCDKDCSDLGTASAVLCEMGKYGSCAYNKVVDGGSYVVGHVQGWFQSSSDSGSNSGNVTIAINSTESGSNNQTEVGHGNNSTEVPTSVSPTTVAPHHEHHHGLGNHNHTHSPHRE